MSGPKVVRVITKQEIMANCLIQIDAFKDAIEQWRKFACKHDVLTVEEEKAVDKKLLSVINMFEREQFHDIKKKCITEIASLYDDIQQIKEDAIAKALQESSKRRRTKYSAETLIKTFKTSGLQIPDELQLIVSTAITSNETELATMNSTLGRIITEYSLREVDKERRSPLLEELAKKLSEGEKIQTLAEWQISHNKDIKSVENNKRLDKLLAEIEFFEDKSAAQPFLARIALIENESLQSRRYLLTDSLIIDLVAHATKQKAKEELIVSMTGARRELRRLKSKSAKELEALLTKAIESGDISLSKKLINRAFLLVKEEMKVIEGSSRREAILQGLAELGYEVQENMATAWVEDGRIVIRKPNEKSYGVELGAIEDAVRIQIQLVTYEQSCIASKASQDLDRETSWCSEFSQLKSLLEQSGTSLYIEKALPIGAKPLKKVQESSTVSVRERRAKESALKQKMND
ncbi:MAG: hypothetical protein H0U70_07510 [Tatlockia sp.]|nr:hypothetical protein [Tatlockia sp.]